MGEQEEAEAIAKAAEIAARQADRTQAERTQAEHDRQRGQ